MHTMIFAKDVILVDDVIKTIRDFYHCNAWNDSIANMILAIGTELLNVSDSKLLEMIHSE